MEHTLSDQDVERIAAAVSARIESDRKAAFADREAAAQRGRENYYAEYAMKEQEKAEAAAAMEREHREFARAIAPRLRGVTLAMFAILAYSLAVVASLHGGWARYVPLAYAMTAHAWFVVFWVSVGLTTIALSLYSMARSAAGRDEPAADPIKPV